LNPRKGNPVLINPALYARKGIAKLVKYTGKDSNTLWLIVSYLKAKYICPAE